MIKFIKKLFSRKSKSTKIEFNDNKVIKFDGWMIEKINSAKVITLAELEEI